MKYLSLALILSLSLSSFIVSATPTDIKWYLGEDAFLLTEAQLIDKCTYDSYVLQKSSGDWVQYFYEDGLFLYQWSSLCHREDIELVCRSLEGTGHTYRYKIIQEKKDRIELSDSDSVYRYRRCPSSSAN